MNPTPMLSNETVSSPTTSSESQSSKVTDMDKTIPFLRRLTDMLQDDNGDAISFHPGDIGAAARIIVHNRCLVENEVLPKYFNHSSFSSLRRQLNYFDFTRIGRGRRNDVKATYQNPSVQVLGDILKLKRKTCVNSSPVPERREPTGMKNKRKSSPSFSKKHQQMRTSRRQKQGVIYEDTYEVEVFNRVPVAPTLTSKITSSNLPPSVSISSFGEIQSTSKDNDDLNESRPSNVVYHEHKGDVTPRIVLDLTQPKDSQEYGLCTRNELEKWNKMIPDKNKMLSYAKEDLLMCSVLLNLGGRGQQK